MNGAIIIKQSPIVLLWNLIAIEILGSAGYFAAVALGNYKYELYTRLSASSIISYQIAKLLFLFGAELSMTLYAFLRWYFESYAIQPGAVTHAKGVLFKKKKISPLRPGMSITSSSGYIGKVFHYGAVVINDPVFQTSIKLSNVSTPQRYTKIIEKYANTKDLPRGKNIPVEKLLSQDEHERLEFKSSFRFDTRSGQVNHDLEKSVMKTVAGFLNSKGGNVVIGVGDGRQPLGLRDDYNTLKRPDSDGFENHFTQIFNAMIGPEFRHLVKLRFASLNDQDLCVVSVVPSARPIYLKLENNEHFYVRTGNVTTPLKMSEAESYARTHWTRTS